LLKIQCDLSGADYALFWNNVNDTIRVLVKYEIPSKADTILNTNSSTFSEECLDVILGIKIKKCGHEFSALPLLYEVMTKVFKCPICRGGSESEVILDQDKVPANMSPKTWKVLYNISTRVREENRRQKQIEENTFPLGMQMSSIIDLYDSMPWSMSFSLYRTENPSTSERPFPIP